MTITSSDPSAISFDRLVPKATVDRLRFLLADGTESRFKRDANGLLAGTQFQGRASFRQLLPASAQHLSRVLDTGSSVPSRRVASSKSSPGPGNGGGGERRPAIVLDVPVAEGVAEGYDVAPSGRTKAARNEAKLQRDFATYLATRGSDVTRKKIQPPDVAYPLYTDLFNRTRNQVIEDMQSVDLARLLVSPGLGDVQVATGEYFVAEGASATSC